MHATEIKLVSDSPLLPARQGSASVVERDDEGGYLLVEDDRTFVARPAASCLLEPQPGDRVWFVSEPGSAGQQRSYVLAVLEREPSEAPARLRIPARAELEAEELSISTSRSLALRGGEQLDLQGEELRVRGRRGRVLLDECSMILRALFSHVGKATFVAKLIETMSERLSVHAQTSLRTVEQLDQVKAGSIDYRAEHSASLGATHTLVNGGELVKVDGGQIHLG